MQAILISFYRKVSRSVTILHSAITVDLEYIDFSYYGLNGLIEKKKNVYSHCNLFLLMGAVIARRSAVHTSQSCLIGMLINVLGTFINCACIVGLGIRNE